MGLTIRNNDFYSTNNTIKNNSLKSQDKSYDFNTIFAKLQDKSSESSVQESGYNPNGVIVFDRKNNTVYFDGIKMDEKFMNIMSMPGYHYTELMALKKTDESILKKIIESNIKKNS